MRKEMKLESMEDLEKAAAAQGLSYEDFKQNLRNQIITQKVIGEEVGSHLAIAKEEQQKFYDEHKSEMEQPEAIQLSEILVAPAKPPAAENKPAANNATADNAGSAAGTPAPPATASNSDEPPPLATAHPKANHP